MTVAGKLTAAFGLLLVLMGATIAYQMNATRGAVSTGFALARIFDRLEQSTSGQASELERMEETASKLGVTADPDYATGLQDAVHAFGATLARGDSSVLAPAERRELARMRALWAPVPAQADSLIAAVRAQSARPGAGAPAAVRRRAARASAAADSLAEARLSAVLESVTALRVQARRLGDASRAVIRVRLERSVDAERAAETISLAIALGAILLSVAVAAWIVRSIGGPLRQLSEATHRVAEGRFDYRFDEPHDQQFARLARDFNRMTARLAELDRMKQQFLSKASHDLKTPLASMQETSRVLLDGVAGPLTPDQQRLLQLSMESGLRLSGMIAKILDLSAIEAGMRAEERVPRDLRQLARQAAELSTPALAQRRIVVTCAVPPQPVVADCDSDGILRVLDNLLENAGRVSPEGATVRVVVGTVDRAALTSATGRQLPAALAASDSVALLVVEDSGPGVPDADRARIFEPFYQAGNGSRARRGGVGLGLAICREIVGAHDGRIWVEDAATGGARFVVALPPSTTVPAGDAATAGDIANAASLPGDVVTAGDVANAGATPGDVAAADATATLHPAGSARASD